MLDLIEFKDFVFRKSEIQGLEKKLGNASPQINIFAIVGGSSYRIVSEQSKWDTDNHGNVIEQLDARFKEVQKEVFGSSDKSKKVI